MGWWQIFLFCFMNFNLLPIYFDHSEHTLLWWSNSIYHRQNMAPGMYFNIILTDNHLSNKPARLLVDTLREGGRWKSSTHKYNSNNMAYCNDQHLLYFLSSPGAVLLSRALQTSWVDGLTVACVRMSHALEGTSFPGLSHWMPGMLHPCDHQTPSLHSSTTPAGVILLGVEKKIYT